MGLSTHSKGTLICIAAVLILSPDSLLLRKLSHVNDFAVLFYRYLIFTIALSVFMVAKSGLQTSIAAFRKLGRLELIAGVVWGINSIAFTYGLQSTAAANVLVINALNPMFAALFSFLILREMIPWYTVVASIACFAAIASMFCTQLSGGSDEQTVIGLFCALVASISMGLYFVLIRLVEKDGFVDSTPCNIINGVLACTVGLCAAKDLQATDGMDWLYLLIDGVIVLAVSLSLLNIGPAMISAPEVSLYTLIETLFGPVWVYLGGYEAPPPAAIYGGTVVVAALVIHGFIALYYDRNPPEENGNSKKLNKNSALKNSPEDCYYNPEESNVAYNIMIDNSMIL